MASVHSLFCESFKLVFCFGKLSGNITGSVAVMAVLMAVLAVPLAVVAVSPQVISCCTVFPYQVLILPWLERIFTLG